MTWLEDLAMEAQTGRADVIDAINHAVRGVQRRSEGLALVADRHSAASKAALGKMLRQAEPAAPVRLVVKDRPGSR